MSDYTKLTNFTAKDALPSGDTNKLVKGSDFDAEFGALQTAVTTKANKAVPTATGNVAALSATGDLTDSGVTGTELNNLVGVTGPIKGAFRGALVYTTGTATTGNTVINWNSESYDTSGIHNTVTNTSRLTVPSGVTKVRITANVWASNGGSTYYIVDVKKNGAAGNYNGRPYNIIFVTTAAIYTIPINSPVLTVVAGDYFELYVGGTASDTIITGVDTTWFAMEIIE